jgi:NAD-dependent deacetylase
VSDRLDDPRPDDDLQTAARLVARSARLAVFTGAGVSKESGIPTFREPETGLWARYDPMELATPEAYERDPAFVWSWYEHRFGVASSAEPNPGHRAIAELETVLPAVVVITQNIDGLHQRAGSTHVIELHGTMRRFRCIRGRHRGYVMDDFADQKEKPPRCPECGDLLRPEVVWFGEGLPPDAIDAAQQLSARCDVMLSWWARPASSIRRRRCP